MRVMPAGTRKWKAAGVVSAGQHCKECQRALHSDILTQSTRGGRDVPGEACNRRCSAARPHQLLSLHQCHKSVLVSNFMSLLYAIAARLHQSWPHRFCMLPLLASTGQSLLFAHVQVFLVAWETCLADRSTLQRVLLTWDRVFPPQPLEAIRQRAGLAPSLASAPAPAPATAGATATAAAAPQPAARPAAASAALSALQAALLGATAAARPPPMQREPASLRPVGQEQQAPTAAAAQQLPVAATLLQPGQPAAPSAAAAGSRTTLGPDQIAALREAASARLAAARAPKPQPQPHRRQPQPQQRRPHQPAPAPAAVGRGREYEPTMPGAAAGGNALRPEQMTQLESLLKSLAQGTSSLPVGTAPVPPAAPATGCLPSADELWSPATLKVRSSSALLHLMSGVVAVCMLALVTCARGCRLLMKQDKVRVARAHKSCVVRQLRSPVMGSWWMLLLWGGFKRRVMCKHQN